MVGSANKQTVDAVEQAAVSRQQSSEVLHADRALHHRLEEVAEGHHDADATAASSAGVARPRVHERQERTPHQQSVTIVPPTVPSMVLFGESVVFSGRRPNSDR